MLIELDVGVPKLIVLFLIQYKYTDSVRPVCTATEEADINRFRYSKSGIDTGTRRWMSEVHSPKP